jgi:cytochrome c oxidase subunit 4
MSHAHEHAVPSREEHIKIARNGFLLLLVVTFIEVGFALVGNGHIGGMHFPKILMILVMTGFSIFKAWFIVSEFMHLGHETRGMAMSVILPTLLLVWAIIAFLWEGDAWRGNRNLINSKNQEPLQTKPVDTKPTGSLKLVPAHTMNSNISFI